MVFTPCIYAVVFLAEGEGIEPYAVARTTDQCQAAHLEPFTPYLSILTELRAQEFLQM